MSTYKVNVVTSDKRNAGTNAKVYIELIGRNERSGVLNLESSSTHKNKYEQGNTDSFELKCKNVGTLKKIRIGHNNSGFSAGWHLKEVVIESLEDGRRWKCECNQWLAKDEADGKIERELDAIEIKSMNEMDKFYSTNKTNEQSGYKISVTTSNIRSSGTNAKVYIELIGRKERSGVINLEKSETHRNKFEQGNTDIFNVKCPSVGSLRRIRIGHNNSGLSPGWHLKDVVVESLEDGRRWKCDCNQWLAKNEADGKIERELDAVEFDGSLDKLKPGRFGGVCLYKVYVATSNINSAGTNSNVFLQIVGKNASTDKIQLKSSNLHRNPFEKGNTDYFEVQSLDVGEIKKIRIGHDNKGVAPGWHLKEVVIHKEDGQTWMFPCNRWLDKREDDGQIERELFPEEPDPSKTKFGFGDKRYIVEVHTGDVPNGGTDANVFLTLFGEHGESPEVRLKESETHRDKFERNHMDRFYIDWRDGDDIGELMAIRIRHDNTGQNPEWFLDRVEIIESDTRNKYTFECQKWLALKKYDSKIDRIIKEKKLMEKEKAATETKKKPKYVPIKKQYFIKLYSKEKMKRNPMEDLSLSVKLFGDRYQSRYYKYLKSKTHETKFCQNQIDLIVIETDDDLGTLYAIELKLKSIFEDVGELDLEKVEIDVDGLKYFFFFENVVTFKNTSNSLRLILLERNAQFL